MTVLGDAISAIKDALKLADDVKRVGATLKDMALELREHDRRITRIEAKWEAAVELSAARAAPRRIRQSPPAAARPAPASWRRSAHPARARRAAG